MKHNPSFILPSAKPGAHIGIFGGSFDPPHLGHTMLGLSFLALEAIDELWIIPCNDHALKESVSPFHDRMAMCKLAFAHLERTQVLDLEHHLPAPNYTINTIQAIMAQRPDLRLSFGLGSDLLPGFERWHKASSLALLAQFVIFEREHYPCDLLPPLLKQARVHQGFALPDTNSTMLRENLRIRPEQLCSLIDKSVQAYIKAQGLYLPAP